MNDCDLDASTCSMTYTQVNYNDHACTVISGGMGQGRMMGDRDAIRYTSVKGRKSPWNVSLFSIDLQGVNVKLGVSCRDDSLYMYLTTQSYARWTYIPGDFYSYHTGILFSIIPGSGNEMLMLYPNVDSAFVI